MRAFVAHGTWRQAELAAELKLSTQVLRKYLEALSEGGMPLERSEETPNVFWSVPKSWLPGGLAVEPEELPILTEALLSLPAGPHRNALLRKLLQGHPRELAHFGETIELTAQSAAESVRSALIEAAANRKALRVRYFTSSQGAERFRTLSVQRVVLAAKPRLAAFCHDSQALRWFRADQVLHVSESNAGYHPVPAAELESFLSNSVDGYHEQNAEPLAFTVPYPAANWVKNNLPTGMQLDPSGSCSEFIRIVAPGGALIVARFITSLGGLARAEGASLSALVRETALAALSAHGGKAPGPTLRKGALPAARHSRIPTPRRRKAAND